MAKPELGTKRVCPETSKKFYDLNRDPIVSPYTGMSYPLSFFEEPEPAAIQAKEEEEQDVAVVADDEEATESTPDTVSLEEADGEQAADESLPGIDDDDDDALVLADDDDDDDPFLNNDDDDDDDDVSGLIVGGARDGDGDDE